MRKTLVLLSIVGLLIVGCSAPDDEGTSISTDHVDSKTVQTVGLGQTCGGSENIRCHERLRCQLDLDAADQTGICVQPVVHEDMECPEIQDPVCGLYDGNKNGYLNACHAERYGAEVLGKGFCRTEDVTGSCSARVTGVGSCEMIITGYEFSGGICREVTTWGCEGEVPFATMEACEMGCK